MLLSGILHNGSGGSSVGHDGSCHGGVVEAVMVARMMMMVEMVLMIEVTPNG